MAATRELQELLAGLVSGPVPACRVGGVALDSRCIRAGELFLALGGTRSRGHEFVADAVARGAVAVVYDAAVALPQAIAVPCFAVDDLRQKAGVIAERFYGQPTRALHVIGVTGTNGKTSCSHFLGQTLDRPNARCGVIGTLGNGLYGELDVATHTTPDAVSVHALMRDFLDRGARWVAMEVSSHGLDQGRVAGVRFDTAVFTNLSRDHLDYHGDMAAYGRAKGRLFAAPGLRCAVINGGDAFGRELLAGMCGEIETWAYTLGRGDDPVFAKARCLRGRLERLDKHGLAMVVQTPVGEVTLQTALLGRFNASNLLAVFGALLAAGLDAREAAMRLSRVTTVPGRMERFGGENQPLVVVDYAHTPDALYQVLTTLREHCSGRLWCVFGCGGDRDRGKRPLMGGIAEKHADRVIVTSDNPRHEDPLQIMAEIRAGMQSGGHVEGIADRAAAIAHAITAAGRDDVVLIAGKGHEDYQQIGDEKLPFSDRVQVLELLRRVA